MYGREGDRWGENESPILSFWGLSQSQFYICLYGREICLYMWGENQSPILGFWGLTQRVFPFFPIHLNGCLRSPIYPLLVLLSECWIGISNVVGSDPVEGSSINRISILQRLEAELMSSHNWLMSSFTRWIQIVTQKWMACCNQMCQIKLLWLLMVWLSSVEDKWGF